MIRSAYPFFCFTGAIIAAQLAKPLVNYFKMKHWDLSFAFATGGMPSSHAAGVAALCAAIAIQEGFDNPLFAITLAFALITAYDAANVRYYAGKNIALTGHLINELKENDYLDPYDPIYNEKIKDVLGHRWPEVLIGALLGIFISGLINVIFY